MITRVGPEIGIWDIIVSLVPRPGDSRADFAESLRSFFGVKKAVLFPSGRSALYYILRALPQKRVYLPGFDCRAVVEAALLAGKKPIYVDAGTDGLNMDPQDLRKKIQADSIVVATHQLGMPCDLDGISSVCNENSCIMIEDNAASFGAEYRGRRTGAYGAASIVSFEYTKALTAARGGAALFQDAALCEKVEALCAKEMAVQPLSTRIKKLVRLTGFLLATKSYVYRHLVLPRLKRQGYYTDKGVPVLSKDPELYFEGMTRFQARLGLLGMGRIRRTLMRRRSIADAYGRSLGGIIHLIKEGEHTVPSYMRYPVLVTGKMDFYKEVLAKGVDLGFSFSYVCGDMKNLKNTKKIAEQILNLPMRSALSDADVAAIIRAVKDSI
ncbi:MAG: DegT/DnrJ/EryC1/StrS family aminotransferase [archaeon]